MHYDQALEDKMQSLQSLQSMQSRQSRNSRKLKIIRNETECAESDNPRGRQSSDPLNRSISPSPSLPPLKETKGRRSSSRHSKTPRKGRGRDRGRDRGQSMTARNERVNPRRTRRSKLKVIRDQRKGSDPKGTRPPRQLRRDRVGAKSVGNLENDRHSDEEKESEPLSERTLSTVRNDGGTRNKMGRHCHLRFFVEMNGVRTYSVVFESSLCGLELCPVDDAQSTGAVVVKCHSTFSQEMVVEGSLLIGIGNEIVLQMDHHRILKRIRCSARPLTLTFYHGSKQRDGAEEREGQYLCLWLASDGSMCFKSKSM